MKQLLLFLFCMFYSYSCFGQVKITMERHGNVYYVPGKVNGLSMKFIFDTGASNVCLSLTEALFMLKNGKSSTLLPALRTLLMSSLFLLAHRLFLLVCNRLLLISS